MAKQSDGKVALITGASSGLGRAITTRFLHDGYYVLACYRTQEHMDVCLEGWDAGDQVLPCQGDVRSRDDVQRAVDAAVQRWGRIDVLVNNAGIAREDHFLDIKSEDWRRIIDVNLTGIFNVAQLVARQMVKQESGGVILNMTSKNGIAAEVKYAHYNASKAGIILLTMTMALDLADYNIRVNAVAPGYILTELPQDIDSPEFMEFYAKRLIPLSRLGTPEDVAGAFAFLAGDDAKFITGTTLVVDGGQICSDGRKLDTWPPSESGPPVE